MLKWFPLKPIGRNYRSSSIELRILLPWQFRSTYWPDNHFNMSNLGGIRLEMAFCTLKINNQSCWSDCSCSRSAETMVASFESRIWLDDHFNMTNWGWIKSRMACSTQETHNQSCWSDFLWSRGVEAIVPRAVHWWFYSHGNSEAATD